jgi:hypothetical protein
MATDEEQVIEDGEIETGEELVLVDTAKLAEVIAGMTEIDSAANATQTRYRIVAEMLAAETEEELWQELPTWSSKNNVGRSFEIGEIRGVFKSRYPDAETGLAGGFLACSAVALDDGAVGPEGETAAAGEAGIFTTSALRVAGKLGWYHQHGKLPVKVEIVKRGQSSGGFDILDVELVK